MNKYLKHIMLAAVAILGMTTFAACGSDDDAIPEEDSFYSVKATYIYEANDDLLKAADIYICYLAADGEMMLDSLTENKWTKTITYTLLPDTALYSVICLPHDNASGTYNLEYNYSMDLSLLKNNTEIVDVYSKEKHDNQEYKDATVEDLEKALDEMPFEAFAMNKEHIKAIEPDDDIDSDLEDSEKTPVIDTDDIKMSESLYYLSENSVVTDQTSIVDNLLARFDNRQKWDGQQELNAGDFLLLNISELSSGRKAVFDRYFDNGVIFIIEDANESQIGAFLDDMGEYNPLKSIPAGQLSSNPATWIVSSDLPGRNCTGLFAQLSAYDSDGNPTSDYINGQIVNLALEKVKKALAPTSRIKTRSEEGHQNINELMAAYQVFITFSQSIRKDEYRWKYNPDVSDPETNVYQIEYDIWNAYEMKQDRNYYYIHQEIKTPFHHTYKGVYNKSVSGIAKVCEWYGETVSVKTISRSGDMTIHRSSPSSTQSSVSYTSGVSWTFSAEGMIGFQADGPMGSISLGASVGFESSRSYDVQDVSISNLIDPGTNMGWRFKLRDISSEYKFFYTAMTKIHEGSLTGRTALVAGTDFIVSFPGNVIPVIEGNAAVNLRSSCSKVGVTCWVRDDTAEASKIISLPYIVKEQIKSTPKK